MRKIWLNLQIERIAEEYRDEVMEHYNPLTALRNLYKALSQATGIPHKQEYCTYVNRLCYYFLPTKTSSMSGGLLSLKPSKWDKKQRIIFNMVHESWFPIKITIPNLGTDTFQSFVNKAMGYNNLRNPVIRKYITKLGIKACYYCNAQYAISVEESAANVYATYDLDHCMPESKFPFLSICFYNFHPSCPACNKHKSNSFIAESMYEEQDGEELNPFRFALDRKSFIHYMLSNNKDDLKIVFDNPSNPTLATNYEKHFHISTIYSQHKDAAEELIWKARCYRDADIDALYTQYRKLFLGKTKEDFKRMLYGYYILPSDIHKRPLNKMLGDIAKQLKIV